MSDSQLDAIIAHQLKVRSATLDLARALVPDEQYDPADDPRAEIPFRALCELIGETSAKGVYEALALLVVEWGAGQ
jgi:hypothetical protein